MMNDPRDDNPFTSGRPITYHDFEGYKPPVSYLLNEISKYKRSDFVEWASTLLLACSELRGQSLEVQKELVKLALQGKYHDRALEHLDRPGRNVVFHRKPLWLLIQFASLVCNEEGISITTISGSLGELVLVASDCLYTIQRVQVDLPDEDTNLLDWNITLLTSAAESFPDNNSIARAYDFWFESVQAPENSTFLKIYGYESGFDGVFLNAYGITLSDFYFGVVRIFNYMAIQARRRPITPIIFNKHDGWSRLISEEHRTVIMGLLSVPTDKFPDYLLGTPRQSWATDYSCLMKHPVLEVVQGQYVCPDLDYLRGYFIDGIFWLLNDAIGKKVWGNVFGSIYEWYLSRVFMSAMHIHSHTQGMYHEKVNFQEKKTAQVCDYLILSDSHAFMFEYKGTRLSTRQKSGVSVEETLDGINKSLAMKDVGVGQLAKHIAKILGGDKVMSNGQVLHVASKQAIVPVIVWQEEAGVSSETRQYMDKVFSELLVEELKERNIEAGTDRVAKLLLLSTHDIEQLEQCSHFTSPEILLVHYSDFVNTNPKDPRCLFLRYLVFTYSGMSPPKGYIGSRIDHVIQHMNAEHRARYVKSKVA